MGTHAVKRCIAARHLQDAKAPVHRLVITMTSVADLSMVPLPEMLLIHQLCFLH